MNDKPQDLEQPLKLDLSSDNKETTKQDILELLAKDSKIKIDKPSKEHLVSEKLNLVEAPTKSRKKNQTLNRAISAFINIAVLTGVIVCLFASYMVFRNNAVLNLRNGNFDLYHCKTSARTTRTFMILCLFLIIFCNIFSILIELNLFRTVFGVSMVVFFKNTHFYFVLHITFFLTSLASLLSFLFGCGYKKSVYYSAGVWVHLSIVILSFIENIRIYKKFVDIKYDDVNSEILNEEFI